MTALFDTHYYYPIKLACSMTGLWPYQSQFRKRILQIFNLFIMCSFFPPQLRKLYQVLGEDIDAVCMCVPPLFTLILIIAKNVTIIKFESKIKMLLYQIEMEWKTISRREESKILTNYALRTGEFSIVYAVILSNGLVCFIIAPTISPILDIILPTNGTRERYLGFELDYGIDLQAYWFWLWLHTSIAGTIVILNYIAVDTIYIMLMFHGCYMFAKVRHKLAQMTDSLSKDIAGPVRNRDYNTGYISQCDDRQLKLQGKSTAMKQCILSHKIAIECAQLLCRIYTWSLFAAAGINIILISISAVQLISKLFRWTEMAMSGMFIIGELIHIFFLNLMAQFILDQSLDVHESAYSCSWYNMPAKIQKDIILILMRSRLPCKMMAGKFFVISLENFCMIVQTSMSYFTVLASFR